MILSNYYIQRKRVFNSHPQKNTFYKKQQIALTIFFKGNHID